MGVIHTNRKIPVLVLLVAAVCIVQAVSADGGSVSITYRGAGGIYIGNMVIFDGQNTVGNVTFLKITGPGLPAEGVPLMDLKGTPGTGNPAISNPDGSWQYDWDTSMVNGMELLQTARYYITAVDLSNPADSSTISVMMDKPDFYFSVTPATPETGDYVQFVGTARNNVESVRLQITDGSGQVLHTFYTPVSATGYFNQGFHIDMQPGSYTVTLDSPTTAATYRTTLQVVSPQAPASNVTAAPTPLVPATPPVTGPVTGTIAVTSTPAGASVSVDSIMKGQTPINLENIPAGDHTVGLNASGYLPYSIQVTVKAGETVTVSPALVKSASPVPLPVLVPVLGVLIAAALAIAVSVRRSKR